MLWQFSVEVQGGMGGVRGGRPPPRLAGRLPLIVACVLTKHTTSLTPKPKQTKLGPGSMEPVEWALYPRGAKLLDEVSATVDEAFQLRYERQEVRLGSLDLRHLLGGGGDGDGDAGGGGDVVVDVLEGPAAPSSSRGDLSLLAALELAARWPHGGVRALVATRTDAARLAAHAIARRVDDRLEEKQCVQVFDEVEAIAAVLQQECRKREKEDNSLLDAMLYGQAKLQHSVLSAFGADAEDRA